MAHPRQRTHSRMAVLPAILILATTAAGQELTREQKEEFLRTANIIRTRDAPKGITGVKRATLQSKDGTFTHDASIQRIDERKTQFQTDRGTEMNFRDSYQLNIAAYKLALLLDLGMVPPTVERSASGNASFTWWVDDVLMDEGDRKQKKVEPPDQNDFNSQYSIVQVFDQLIYNVDRNVGNLLIDKNWRLWMIDHSRTFRLQHTLPTPKLLKMCERNLLARMKTLDEATLTRELGKYLNKLEIQGVLKRRDVIVAFFDKAGPSALYSYSTKR